MFAQVSPGVRAGIAAAEEIPSAGQLGSPALPAQGLVQVGDEELVQLQAGHRDQGLDVQLLPTEDGGGVGPAGMVEYRVCSRCFPPRRYCRLGVRKSSPSKDSLDLD